MVSLGGIWILIIYLFIDYRFNKTMNFLWNTKNEIFTNYVNSQLKKWLISISEPNQLRGKYFKNMDSRTGKIILNYDKSSAKNLILSSNYKEKRNHHILFLTIKARIFKAIQYQLKEIQKEISFLKKIKVQNLS